MVVSLHVQYIGHVLHVWNLHVVRAHACVRVCLRVSECVRVCQARQVYRHGEFTDTLCLQTKPNQTKPNQTKPNQTKPNQTKPNQNKTKQNKTVSLQTRYVYKTKQNWKNKTKRTKLNKQNKNGQNFKNKTTSYLLTWRK